MIDVAPPPPSCQAPTDAFPVLWAGQVEAQPGRIVPLAPQWATSTLGPIEAVAPGCVGAVKLSAGAPATVTPDGGGVAIAADARDGAVITVSVEVAGRLVEGRLLVVDPALHPLARTWREQAVSCPDGTQTAQHHAVRELVFDAQGRFSVTWEPFESYRDYWGTYDYDLKSGRLSMTVTAGNRIPPGLHLEGLARVEPKFRLVLTGVVLGEPQGAPLPAACSTRFLGG